MPPKPSPLLDTAPSGVLLIDKGLDMTSHDAVAIARRSLGIKKIGHCGTLDPQATGLLILVINKATKLQDLLMCEDKEYVGTLTLGVTTTTQDREGEIVETKEVPPFTDTQLKDAFESFLGNFDQIPPMASAIKKNGVPLYKLARKGQEIERDARPVRVDSYTIDRVALPEVDFTIRCSKGFYVRAYAADLGEKLGCGGYLSALRRTRSGYFTLDRAVTIETLKTAPREELYAKLIPISEIAALRGV